MAAVTWKNIAPSNPSGLLSAANQAAQSMGQGISGIGTALQSGVDKKVESETNDFVADLMAAGSQEERDAMIAAANDSFLNLDQVNKTNYELGAPDREMDMFNNQLASQTVVDQAAAAKLAENQMLIQKEKNLANKNTSSSTKGSGTYGPGSTGFGKNPFLANGIYDSVLGKTDDSQWWMGPGMNEDDKSYLNKQKSDFLAKTTVQNLGITDAMFNELSNDSTITFKDDFKDSFVFTHEGKPYAVDGSDASNTALMEIIQNKYLGTQSTRQVDRTKYYDVFTKNNPKLIEEKGYEGAKDVFTSIYKRNKLGSNSTYNADLATEIFGKMSDSSGTSGFTSTVPKDDNYEYQVSNATRNYRNLNLENLQKRFDQLSNGKNLDSEDQANLEALQNILNARNDKN